MMLRTILHKSLAAVVLLLSLFFYSFAAAADTSGALSEVEHLKENSFSCRFDGIKHKFILDLPDQTDGAPLVLMLPGYGNTAESFRSTVHFEQEANARGYAAAWVPGARNPNDPLSSIGWNSGIGVKGNDDTAFLTALAKYLQKEYSFDEHRMFAAGFSNGAFMVHRLAMEAADTFSACVSVAGLMPVKIWDARKERSDVSFFQISGEMDDVVPKNSDVSAKFAKDPAIEDVVDYWAGSNGLVSCGSETIGNGSVLTRYCGEQTVNQVWSLLVKNGRHSWPDVKLNGIDANDLILDFFDAVSPR